MGCDNCYAEKIRAGICLDTADSASLLARLFFASKDRIKRQGNLSLPLLYDAVKEFLIGIFNRWPIRSSLPDRRLFASRIRRVLVRYRSAMRDNVSPRLTRWTTNSIFGGDHFGNVSRLASTTAPFPGGTLSTYAELGVAFLRNSGLSAARSSSSIPSLSAITSNFTGRSIVTVSQERGLSGSSRVNPYFAGSLMIAKTARNLGK